MAETPSYHDLVDLTDDQMMEHTRCPSTLKSYKSNISILCRFLTVEEREAYLISDQLAQMVPGYPYLMRKSIPNDIMARILRDSQIKMEIDGKKFLKSPSSFKSYCSSIQFWYMKSREFQERMGTEDFLYEVLDLFEEDVSHEVFIQTADVFVLISCPQALTELMS